MKPSQTCQRFQSLWNAFPFGIGKAQGIKLPLQNDSFISLHQQRHLHSITHVSNDRNSSSVLVLLPDIYIKTQLLQAR